MIEVTERAAKKLKNILSESVDMPQARLRLIDRGQEKLGLGIDIEASTDYIVEHEGSTVLIVGQELATRINDITLDVEDTPDGNEFILRYRPKDTISHE